jgi:hypothetical protein
MLESLRLRVDNLHKHLGKPDRFYLEPAASAIDNLKGQVDGLAVAKSWDEIVDKYRRLKLLLETPNVKRHLDASHSKAVTVLENKELLVASQKQLERVQALRHHLNFEPLHDLVNKRIKLRTLELSAVALTSLASQKRRRLDALLQEYNETLLQVSQAK